MNPLEKEFVPYPEAFELKQLSFDEPCFGWFASDKSLVKDITIKTDFTLAPTYSQAFRFFRKKYKLQTYIDFYHSESYFFKIKSQDGRYIGNTGDVILQGSPLFTRPYEEAELACLRKLIEIVKNK